MAHLAAHEMALCHEVRAMCACNPLRRAARTMTRLYDAAMAPTGLKVTQLPILVGLGSDGELPITALADALGLDRTTLTRNLKVLEDRGLVSVAPADQDARVRLVSLTDAGACALAGALASWKDVQETVQAQFGEQRLRALYGDLDELAAAVGA
jgi:DNA-binding MarR family transcriptional regulator